MGYGGIRAIVIQALHKIVPEYPTIYSAYRAVKEVHGTYDYATMLGDVRHAVHVFRYGDAQQDYNVEKYIPKRIMIESDRVRQGNYKQIYMATWTSVETGEEFARFASIYSNAQMLPSEILETVRSQMSILGKSPDWKLTGVERISVWHRRGSPYAEGGYLAEL